MKNILVFGASGFIGKNLVDKLSNTYHVVAYMRKHNPDIAADEIILGDFTSETNFEEILKIHNIDTIYHLISSSTPSDGTDHIEDDINNTVLPTIRLLNAMKNTGVKRMIFTSSGGTVYGEFKNAPHTTADPMNPICSYGVHKVILEQYLQLYNYMHNMECRIARISNPYGLQPQKNRHQGVIPIFLEKLLNQESIQLLGNTERDYIHIDDVVNALIKYGEYNGDRFILNIASGQSVKLYDLLRLLEEISGLKFVSINSMPPRKCDVQKNVLDISETQKELNWSPKIDLQEGIKNTWSNLCNLKED